MKHKWKIRDLLFWVLVENTAIKRKDIHLFIFKFSLLASVFSCEAWGGGGVQVKKNPCFIGVAWNPLYFHNRYHFFQCYRISSHKQHFQLFQFTNLIRQCRQLVIMFTRVVSSLHSLIQPFQILQFTNLIRQCSQLVTTQVQSPEILEMFYVWRYNRQLVTHTKHGQVTQLGNDLRKFSQLVPLRCQPRQIFQLVNTCW